MKLLESRYLKRTNKQYCARSDFHNGSGTTRVLSDKGSVLAISTTPVLADTGPVLVISTTTAMAEFRDGHESPVLICQYSPSTNCQYRQYCAYTDMSLLASQYLNPTGNQYSYSTD